MSILPEKLRNFLNWGVCSPPRPPVCTPMSLNWDHFDILATGQSDIHGKIKETLFIRDLKPALDENVGSAKLLLEGA